MKKRLFSISAWMIVFSLISTACATATPAPSTAAVATNAPAATNAPSATSAPADTSVPAEGNILDAPGLPSVPRNKTLILGWWGPNTTFSDYQSHTPFVVGVTIQQGMNIEYEGMAYWNAFDNKTTMWQAESFEYNSDFTSLTIKLRPEVMWSDGTPFTADDVVYTVNTLRDLGQPGATNPVRYATEVAKFTKEAVKVDDHTVTINFTQPSPRYFWTFFTWKWDSFGYPIMPKHIMEGQDWGSFNAFDIAKGWPVTTGPLKVVYMSPTKKIWDRRTDWWAVKAGVAPHELNMDRVINVPTGGDPTVLTELLASAQIDISHLGADSNRAAVEQSPKVTTHSGRAAPYGYTDWWPQSMWVNNTVKPFDNADVRWCISYSIDRQKIIDVAWEGNNVINPMPYPPYAGLLKYTDSIKDLLATYDTNEFNLDKAAERCQKAGYTKGSDGIWANAAGEKLKIPFESWAQWDASAQVLVEELKQAGFDATMSDPPDEYNNYIAGHYVATAFGHAGSLQEPYEAMALYACANRQESSFTTGNYSGWCNTDFDKIVADMSKTDPSDFATESALFHKAMEIWLPELPDIPLFNWMHNFGMNETYWTNWPTVDNKKDGEYVNEASQLQGFLLVLTHLEATGAP